MSTMLHAMPISHPRRGFDFSKRLAEKGWFHSAELPDEQESRGHNSLESLCERYSRFPLPGRQHSEVRPAAFQSRHIFARRRP